MKIEYMLDLNHNMLKSVEVSHKQPESIVNCLIEYQAEDDITSGSFIDCANVNGAQWKYLCNNGCTGIEIQPDRVMSKEAERDVIDLFMLKSKNIFLLIKGTNYDSASN